MYAATIAAQLVSDMKLMERSLSDFTKMSDGVINASIILAKKLVAKIDEEELQEAIDKDQRKA